MVRTELQPGPATDHYHETLGVAATPIGDFADGAQTVRLLGPYPVAFDTPGLVNPLDAGVDFTDLIASGSVIFSVWATNPIAWNSSGPDADHWLQVQFNGLPIASFDLRTGVSSPEGAFSHPRSENAFAVADSLPFVTAESGYLSAAWLDVTGLATPNAGNSEIFALVAEPS